MIFDKITNHKNYRGLNMGIDTAFDYLLDTDLKSLKTGKYVIEEDKIFAVCMEYDTKTIDFSKNEAHRKFIDVQYIISGIENLYVAGLEKLKIDEVYDDEKDVAFYEKIYDCILTAKAGDFAVFFPGDVHMPGVNAYSDAKHVKKVVVKVHV